MSSWGSYGCAALLVPRGARAYLSPALVEALAAFRREHGHVCVPTRYRWCAPPPAANGGDNDGGATMALGSRVAALRRSRVAGKLPAEDVAALDALGFVWDAGAWRWGCVRQSLRAYQELHGDLQVPRPFVVPSEAPWPEAAWGLGLGRKVDAIRGGGGGSGGALVKDHPERRAELDALGFVWDDRQRRWEEARAALLAYQQVCGDLQVPASFVVPSEAPWPEGAWGFKLGHRVSKIRHDAHFVKGHPERRAELDAMGFVWAESERRWEEVRAALLAYQKVHGDLQVPKNFAVPSEAPWPEVVCGMKLGERVNSIRNSERYVKGHPERRAELDALGFVWDDRQRRWEEVRAALLVYKEVHGDLEVPKRFVVPPEAPWPEAARGVRLGSRVNFIRTQHERYVKDHPERCAELDALGFVWDAHALRWEEVYAALRHYERCHGALRDMPRNFVVPTPPPGPSETETESESESGGWPPETWGLALGQRLCRVRADEHYVKDHPERRAQLDALGFDFVWWDAQAELRWEEAQEAARRLVRDLDGLLELKLALPADQASGGGGGRRRPPASGE
jgi:hypothetical protein